MFMTNGIGPVYDVYKSDKNMIIFSFLDAVVMILTVLTYRQAYLLY